MPRHDGNYKITSILQEEVSPIEKYKSTNSNDEEGDGPKKDSNPIVVNSLSKLNEASMWSCIVVLSQNMLGAGTLTMPYAISNFGYVLGPIILCISACFSAFGLHCLCCSAKRAGVLPSSFYSVCHIVIPQYTWIVDLAVAIKCFGVATSYLIILADLLPDAFGYILGESPADHPDNLLFQRWFWVTLAVIILTPLVLAKNLTALKYTSSFSVLFLFFLSLVTIFYKFNDFSSVIGDPCSALSEEYQETCPGEIHAIEHNASNMLPHLSIFVFAYTCHQNSFTMVNELRNNSTKRLNTVILCSLAISFSIFLTLGLTAYLTYGNLQGDRELTDLLKVFPENGFTTTLRIFTALLVMFTFPLQSHPSRICIMNLLKMIYADDSIRQPRQNKKKRSGDQFDKRSQEHLIPYGKLSNPAKFNYIENVEEDEKENIENGERAKSSSLSPSTISATPTEILDHSRFLRINSIANSPNDIQYSLAPQAHDNREMDADDEDDGHVPRRAIEVFSKETLEKQYYIISILYIVASWAIACSVSDLGIVLSIVGATGSTTVSYILPGLLYYLMHPKPHLKRYFALFQFIIGCCLVPFCLYFIFAHKGKGGGGE